VLAVKGEREERDCSGPRFDFSASSLTAKFRALMTAKTRIPLPPLRAAAVMLAGVDLLRESLLLLNKH
jgi:hypothetical protein